MNESEPKPESAENLRQAALLAYQAFIEKGVTSPDRLDLKDEAVKQANQLYYDWQKTLDAEAEGNREAEHWANLAKTIFYVEAGFTDPEYLKDILGFLDSDLQDAEEGGAEPLTEVAEAIKAKMSEIEAKLDQQ